MRLKSSKDVHVYKSSIRKIILPSRLDRFLSELKSNDIMILQQRKLSRISKYDLKKERIYERLEA